MDKLQYFANKTLKLTNVLKYKLIINEDSLDFNVAIEQMKSYIKTKGAMQIGPLIQYTRTFMNDDGKMDVEIVMMLQCSNFIHNVEQPYSMEPVIRVQNALYCRYTGPEFKLRLAYDKINIEAFEEDIDLGNCNYTIFVNNNAEEDTMTVDVFVPRAE